ncbi:hypothetical protein ACRRTK_013663 [Alexandromys fortis]
MKEEVQLTQLPPPTFFQGEGPGTKNYPTSRRLGSGSCKYEGSQLLDARELFEG